jgi:hypothetical protein
MEVLSRTATDTAFDAEYTHGHLTSRNCLPLSQPSFENGQNPPKSRATSATERVRANVFT